MGVGTPFHERTSELCTSLAWTEWAGYFAASRYGSSHVHEYEALRQTAGLIDVSPLFKYRVQGPDARRLLDRLVVRDIARIGVGRVAYTPWCNEAGQVIDDGNIARLGEEDYRLTAIDPSWIWLADGASGLDVDLADETEALGALALQGPAARKILTAVVKGAEVETLRYFDLAHGRIGSLPVTISRTGYTGDLGYEIWIDAGDATEVWDRVMEAGADHRLRPAGLLALDMTRVEAGYVLADVDYLSARRALNRSQMATPFELGLGWTVSPTKAAAYVGQAALEAEREDGSATRLVGLIHEWNSLEALYEAAGLPPQLPDTAWRTPLPVYGSGGEQIGRATSGTWSPVQKESLALARLDASRLPRGGEVLIEHTVLWERCTVPARIVDLPFYDPPQKRALEES